MYLVDSIICNTAKSKTLKRWELEDLWFVNLNEIKKNYVRVQVMNSKRTQLPSRYFKKALNTSHLNSSILRSYAFTPAVGKLACTPFNSNSCLW